MQHVLSKRLYEKHAEVILDMVRRPLSPEGKAHRAHLRSQMGFNAGRRFDAVPTLQCFRTASAIFRVMLRLRLYMDDPTGLRLGGVCPLCDRGAPGKYEACGVSSLRHYQTQCEACGKAEVHDRLKRGALRTMYRSLGVTAFVEARGLYSGKDERPADLGVPPSVHNTPKLLALDIGITDPTIASHRHRASDSAMWTARQMEEKKLKAHAAALRELGPGLINCQVHPLIFETSGAFGKRAQQWWEKMVMVLAKERDLTRQCLSTMEGVGSNPDLIGTWSANTWAALTLQKIDWQIGVALAEKVSGRAAEAISTLFDKTGGP